MPAMTLIGLALWTLFLLVCFELKKVPGQNRLVRAVMGAIALFLVGIVFTVIGLLGLAILAPVLYFFGWGWFLTTNF